MNTMISPMTAEVGPSLESFQESAAPSPVDLYGLFNPFLIRWANLASQYVTTPMEELAHLPMERAIYFPAPVEGLLVLRSTREFEEYLTKSAAGRTPRGPFREKGLFPEMAVLFWHALVLKTWNADSRTLPPARLKSSVPLEWPDRKPDSACTLFIRNFPLEIRLWKAVWPGELAS